MKAMNIHHRRLEGDDREDSGQTDIQNRGAFALRFISSPSSFFFLPFGIVHGRRGRRSVDHSTASLDFELALPHVLVSTAERQRQRATAAKIRRRSTDNSVLWPGGVKECG